MSLAILVSYSVFPGLFHVYVYSTLIWFAPVNLSNVNLILKLEEPRRVEKKCVPSQQKNEGPRSSLRNKETLWKIQRDKPYPT